MAKRTNKTMKKTTTTKRVSRSKETAGRSTCKTSTPHSGAKAGIVTEQRIRERAFEIYLSRNGGCSDALSDWFQAERELHS